MSVDTRGDPGKKAGSGHQTDRRHLGKKCPWGLVVRGRAVHRQDVKTAPPREDVEKEGVSRARHRLAGVPGAC